MASEVKSSSDISKVLLLDFYGQLLTDKAYGIADLYLNEDMSLSEISEELGISRQAVHDTLRRAVKALENYEQKLCLVDRFLELRGVAAKALKEIDSGRSSSARTELLKLIEKI
ncbi:MAG: sigma factor-like helix-turn-helix DNA-binding protein [Eubacteriales bacterium]|nr:sigma factor-like helix-turn-helix DNA-binding protein [Eubacteriales bacterium]MDD4326738.1 sigma factor-like helix-turn-helix DNA-binding protein [Eubacteriales bacterium]MDD4716497.1 sigma factor-like helix-turn-helix DNA-binding protein [Eubacteriales bacterium]NCU25393.1 winged helix-turn-helix transcriptional regulator [Candidatus Nomurabacteria bacterium]